MKRLLTFSIVTLLAVGSITLSNRHANTQALAADAGEKATMIAHNVYFSLTDNSDAAKQKLLDACHKYLPDHPGTVFFAAGTLSSLDRPVNDRDWDVGLHVVFKDLASHDKYQTDPRHVQFIEENRANWKKVRVFDSDVTGGAKK